MRFTSWLRTLTSVWHHGKTIGKGRRAARPRPGYRPRLEALEDRCLLSAGVLDPTFNPTGSPPGTVTTAFSSSDGAGATAVAIQRDGKIVAAGNDGTAFAVARYNGNGSLDTSWATTHSRTRWPSNPTARSCWRATCPRPAK